MRRKAARLQSPWMYAAVGATIASIPASAAGAAGADQAQPGAGSNVRATPKHRRIIYGRQLVVTGHAPAADGGAAVALVFTRMGSGAWRQIASSRVRSDGSFRLTGSVSRSGWVRALIAPGGPAAPGQVTAGMASARASRPEPVAVAGAFRLRRRSTQARAGGRIRITGRLLPALAGRRVTLEAERSGRWVVLSRARTDGRGGFVLRSGPLGAGQAPLRVGFAGDRANTGVFSRAGRLTTYQQAVASWYVDSGSTACGFHAYYGVASVTVPCGTPVSFMYHGRRVRAVVDDRGPFVPGRSWDLNQNTASALGFAGVDTVWSSR